MLFTVIHNHAERDLTAEDVNTPMNLLLGDGKLTVVGLIYTVRWFVERARSFQQVYLLSIFIRVGNKKLCKNSR